MIKLSLGIFWAFNVLAAVDCPAGCTRNGTCNLEIGRCDCPKHLGGQNCSRLRRIEHTKPYCWNAKTIAQCAMERLPCLNACNGRGACIAGWCHCNPGFWGAHCSLSMGPSGAPVLLAGTGYASRIKRPRVYIYDIPHRYSSWYSPVRLDRPLFWVFWQRLLGSGAQVADGEEADWFFIPIKLRTTNDGELLLTVIQHIRKHWPWFDRYGGGRHFVVHVGDTGRGELSRDVMEASANMTWLHHFGLTQAFIFSGWKAAHRPGQDVVIPIFLSSTTHHGHIMDSALHPAAPRVLRNNTLLFSGRICGDYSDPQPEPGKRPRCRTGANRGYSQGVRQEVFFNHYNRTGFKLVTKNKQYSKDLLEHRFCLAPTGGGHGHRQTLVQLKACVPVCIGDDVLQPFEPELPWTRFALSMPQKDIPQLHQVLAGVSAARYASMQDALRCAMQHLAYSSIGGAFMRESGRYDAFETTLEILRMQRQYPKAHPSQYSHLDPDYARFVNCGYDTFEGYGAAIRKVQESASSTLGKWHGRGPNDKGRDMGIKGRSTDENVVKGSSSTGIPDTLSWGRDLDPWWKLLEQAGAFKKAGSADTPAQGGGLSTSRFVSRSQLCSQSGWDPEDLRCGACAEEAGWKNGTNARAAEVLYRGWTPGGNICCKDLELAHCPRLWQ